MHQWVEAEDTPEMGLGYQEKECEAGYRRGAGPQVQMAALSQMQLQAMERMDAQEKELWRPSALLVEHQMLLKSLLERPCQETTQA